MRSSYYLLVATMILLFTCAAPAQDFTLQLTPPSPPIEIPEQGGSFTYQVAVTNNDSTSQECTLWCIVTTPTGNQREALEPFTASIAAGYTAQRSYTLTIPATALLGNYILTAYLGIYPNTIWDSDQFTFYKLKPPEWVARYNCSLNGFDLATSLAVDSDGNIYVTGSSENGTYPYNFDYATIKYDPSGNQLWVAHYNGPGNYDDYANSLVVDGGGNVYVTGYSWNGTNNDYNTIKYDASGSQLWVARYNGLGNSTDVARSLVVDRNSNVYVTGYSIGSVTFGDYATIKYDAAGNQLWVARYNGIGNGSDGAHSLAVDGEGNVYVTGGSDGSGNYNDYATIKYDASGNELWVARYNGPGNSSDQAYSLAVDGDGSVYVTGSSIYSESNDDYVTIKYDANGYQLWVARYNGPGNEDDVAYSLAVDGDDNVYVTGTSWGSGTGYDYATLKYDASGNQLWVACYISLGYYGVAHSIAVAGSGNVYVTGESSEDYVTIKYDASGNQLWVARYNGPVNGSDRAHSLAVDSSGNVYVTGDSFDSGTYWDYTTIKYSGGNLAGWEPLVATVLGTPLPSECRLEQNYPNPFNATTVARYKLQDARQVSLQVYDTAGRLVSTLINGWREAGSHEVTFDASGMTSGVYLARLTAGDFSQVQKLVLLK